jgi:hypothetical protein
MSITAKLPKILLITFFAIASHFLYGHGQMEKLDRGALAVKTNEGVFLSWRILVTKMGNTGFAIYRDNSHLGFTDEPILKAYTLSGRLLWEINLGRNIREVAHYTQFMVYDIDSDGIAEIACKTASGNKDGTGNFLNKEPAMQCNHQADYRSQQGVQQGRYLNALNSCKIH